MKILIIHNEGNISSSLSGTAYQVLKITDLFKNSKEMDESKIEQKYIKEYDEEKNKIIFVTRAVKYTRHFQKAEKIYWSHNYYIPKQIIVKNEFKKIVGVSTFHQLWLTFRFKSLAYCIYNTYDYIPKYNKSRDFSKLSVAFVGSLNKEKGFNQFIKVLKEIESKKIKCDVKIFGEGNESHLIEDFNDSIFISIKWYGKQKKQIIYKELTSTVFLLYGLNEIGSAETFGLSFLDAQMCGCIPITLNRGACYEVIDQSIQDVSLCKNLDEVIDKITSFESYNFQLYSRQLYENSELADRFDVQKFRKLWCFLLSSKQYPNYSIYFSLKYFIREFNKRFYKKFKF